MTDRGTTWCWRLLAGVLIAACALLHLVYLTHDCPLDLAPDEAHYWDWSRQLDWSYYSKGPLVAWLIRGSCTLLGEVMPAVRLPAVLCGALLLVSLYILTVQVFRQESLAFVVVACALTLPPVWALSMLMTIDAPFLCLWGWALVLGYQAAVGRSAWAWPLLGLVIGFGILAKYTMVLFLPSLALFLLTSTNHRRTLAQPGFWCSVLIAGLMCLPILIWNFQHDWVSYRHVNAIAVEPAQRFQPLGPLVYLGHQLALLLGFWFVLWLMAMVSQRPWRDADPGRNYLWWLSAPVFGVFGLFSFTSGGGEINWPATAYLSGLVLAAGWLAGQLRQLHGYRRGLPIAGMASAVFLGLAGIVLMHASHRAYPLLAKLTGPPTIDRPLPMRRIDPTCRLRGWRTLAAAVDQVRHELRCEGIEPVLAGSIWWLPGQLAFYCQGQPTVYCLGPLAGTRASQYDLWRPNPLCNPEVFQGHTFILIGDVPATLREAFEVIESRGQVYHAERGQPINAWPLAIGRGYRGPQPISTFPSW